MDLWPNSTLRASSRGKYCPRQNMETGNPHPPMWEWDSALPRAPTAGHLQHGQRTIYEGGPTTDKQ